MWTKDILVFFKATARSIEITGATLGYEPIEKWDHNIKHTGGKTK